MKFNRRLFCSMAMAFSLPLSAGQALAQEAERLDLATVVVGYPPGGGADSVARIVAEALRGIYADAVVVENRPGAGGRIAAAYVKDQPADGKWLLYTPAFPMVIHPHIYDDMPFDTLSDFKAVAPTNFSVIALTVGPGMPEEVQTLADFVDWAKANPDLSSYGAPVGGSQHFVGAMFARDADIEFELIAYPGGAPTVVDALGGHTPSIINPLQEVITHHNEGGLRTLAISARERTALAPDIPTFYEQGYENIVIGNWSGFLAPAGTPDDIVERANAAVAIALQDPKVIEGMAMLGVEPHPETPEEFTNTVAESWEFYRAIVEETGFRAEE